MELSVDEIHERQDAERLSEIVLRSVRGEEVPFNPFQGRVFMYSDGSIKFMGRELASDEAFQYIADHIWKNRKKLNKEIGKWKKMGPNFVNCGC